MPMRGQSVRVSTFVIAAMILLGGCAETQLAFHTAKKIGTSTEQVPQPRYKIGDPYPIKGVYYYPAVDYRYVETGIASWYGRKFHGRSTANGEIYDMNQLTAAHRTLPLPSIVRVINLENGRALRVRVNDRGPFARGRIIDLSRRAAHLLGFRYKGTARVRVEILADESRDVASRMAGPGIRNAGLVTRPPPAPGRVTAQSIDPPGAVRRTDGRCAARASNDVPTVSGGSTIGCDPGHASVAPFSSVKSTRGMLTTQRDIGSGVVTSGNRCPVSRWRCCTPDPGHDVLQPYGR